MSLLLDDSGDSGDGLLLDGACQLSASRPISSGRVAAAAALGALACGGHWACQMIVHAPGCIRGLQMLLRQPQVRAGLGVRV